jgi:hypothetical protein
MDGKHSKKKTVARVSLCVPVRATLLLLVGFYLQEHLLVILEGAREGGHPAV